MRRGLPFLPILLALLAGAVSVGFARRDRRSDAQAYYFAASSDAAEADSGADAGPDTGVPYDSGVESVDDQFAAANWFQWPASPSGCAPDAALSSRDGGPYIPISPSDAAVGCGASTNFASGRELVGNLAGITKLNTLNDALDMTAGRGGYVTTTASGLPAVADGANFGMCTLFRPTSTSGTKTFLNVQASSSEYQQLKYTNPNLLFRVRESGAGSGNIDTSLSSNIWPSLNEWHFACGLYQGVAEGGTNPRAAVCIDGFCQWSNEFALNLQGFGTPSATGTSISGESNGSNLMVGDLARVWYGPGAAHDALFGSTASSIEARFRQLSQDLGITTHRKALLLIGGGQSNMVGYPNAAESTTQTHTNFEGVGSTNDIQLLIEGTGSGAYESMGKELGDELREVYNRGEDVLWVERGVSNSSIASWASGQSNHTTLMSWVTNAVNFARGKWPSLRAFVFWDQGEQEISTNCNATGWATALAAIQDAIDTTVRALTGVEALEVVMFLDQTSNFTDYNCTSSDLVSTEQYVAGIVDYPGRIRLCEPKYQYATSDGVHITAAGQRAKGRTNARCLDWYLRTGDWKPVHVASTSRTTNVVTAQVWTPTPPLVGSCTGTDVTDPGNGGWEWSDTGSSRTISSVAYGACTGHLCPVTITLSGAPSGTMRLRYAYSGSSGANGGPTTGARGCVHDSASDPPNWMVHSNVSVE